MQWHQLHPRDLLEFIAENDAYRIIRRLEGSDPRHKYVTSYNENTEIYNVVPCDLEMLRGCQWDQPMTEGDLEKADQNAYKTYSPKPKNNHP